ncbi:vWA domain-containing protein [Halorubrum distributum]|uniref:vWA domain-containing protein n=1 Tax=Halorubrum distributum TaxID=29283 RepID=UPI0009B59B0F|nr:VWA domain-containing protein [Halorubrum distributum]MDV7349557.1 VWA domain-containing protein [Halorubrum distributum]
MGLLFGSSGPSKLSVVKDNSKEFVEELHRKKSHIGAVSYFDSSYSVGTARRNPADVKSDISSLSTGGKTALNDSIIESMKTLRHAQLSGKAPIPALLLTFTDGKENRSEHNLNDVRNTIDEIGFKPSNGCYFAIAGIGNASQQDLKDMCSGGRGLYTHTKDDINKAFALFLEATLAVVKGRESYREIRKNEQNLSLKQLERKFTQVRIIPLQYMLNIDTSGSMSNSP